MNEELWSFVIFVGVVVAALIAFFVVLYKVFKANDKRAEGVRVERVSQYEKQYRDWWNALAGEAINPVTSPQRLREMAVAAMPANPELHVAYLEILRLVATNPSTPSEIQNGLVARIGSEESSIRTNNQLQQVQNQLRHSSKKRGGGFIVGGGVGFPLD